MVMDSIVILVIFVIMVGIYKAIISVCDKSSDHSKHLDLNSDGKIDEEDLKLAKKVMRKDVQTVMDIKHELDRVLD